MKFIGYITFFLFFLSGLVDGHDCLYDLEVSTSDCVEGEFYVTLSFQYDSIGDKGFSVKGNGVDYGDYSYADLPVKIGPLAGDGSLFYEFVVFDNETPSCSTAVELGIVDCNNPCSINDLVVDPANCTSSETFSVYVDFVPIGFSSFDIYVNGHFFQYYDTSQLPLQLDSFPASGNAMDKMKICANDRGDCCATAEVMAPDCIEVPCFTQLEAAAIDCDSGFYYVKLKFKHPGEHSDSFKIDGNGVCYGVFAYTDLPVTFGPFSALTDEVPSFRIYDATLDKCISEFVLEDIPCHTFIDDLRMETFGCDSNTYNVAIKFSSSFFTLFDVYFNGEFVVTGHTAQLPLTIPDLPWKGEKYDRIKICPKDSNLGLDCKVFEIQSPCFKNECSISNLNVESTFCDDGYFFAKIDFQYGEDVSDRFYVKGNGEIYGLFSYDSLPLKIGPLPGDGSISYEFVIKDEENLECNAVYELGEILCGCPIRALEYQVKDCTSDSTYILKLKAEVSPGLLFDLFLNDAFLGEVKGEQFPLYLEYFPITGKEVDIITICAQGEDSCCQSIKIEAPDCLKEDCSFSGLEYQVLECDRDGLFYVKVNFEPLITNSDFFIAKGNGKKYGEFKYKDLPVEIGPFDGMGEDFYELVLIDSKNENCRKAIEIGRIVCDHACKFEGIDAFPVSCLSDSTYLMKIEKFESTLDAYDIYINEKFVGYYRSTNFPIELEVHATGKMYDLLTICASDNQQCCVELEILAPNCMPANCIIGPVGAEIVNCDRDTFSVRLKFETEGTSTYGFEIFGNGVYLGAFEYGHIPVNVGPFLADGTTQYQMIIRDLLTDTCSRTLDIGSVTCPNRFLERDERMLVIHSAYQEVNLIIPDLIKQQTNLAIYDLQGRVVYNSRISSTTDRIYLEVPGLNAGFYVIHLKTSEDDFTGKFIIH